MPTGTPTIGKVVREEVEAAREIGTINIENVVNTPAKTSYGSVDLTEELPPWERDPKWSRDNTDARRFVEVPKEWELRWINPRMLDQHGWRDWQPVMASDKRVKVKVKQLVSAEGNIRRGHGGDILGFMPKTWVESKKRLKAERVARMTQSAPDRMEQFREEVSQGRFGPYVHADDAGRHPTHTMGEGRSMTD